MWKFPEGTAWENNFINWTCGSAYCVLWSSEAASVSASVICNLSYKTFFTWHFFNSALMIKAVKQPAITCSKLTIETLEQGVKCAQCKQ